MVMKKYTQEELEVVLAKTLMLENHQEEKK